MILSLVRLLKLDGEHVDVVWMESSPVNASKCLTAAPVEYPRLVSTSGEWSVKLCLVVVDAARARPASKLSMGGG